MNDITLGQFIPGNSVVHRLDSRTKLGALIGYIAAIFLIQSLPLFLLPLLFIIATLLLANISLHYIWKSLKPIRFLLIFMFILNIFIANGDTVLFSFWILTVTKEALRQAVFITLRLALLVSGSSLLTLTTSPLQLTNGLEKALSPLNMLHFPVHELAMMMTIALRFIPTLMEETDKIRKAQMARGVDFETGGPITRAKAMLPILIPLFVSAFRRADELAMAMESRCYHGGEGRTKLHALRYNKNDLIAALILLVMLAAILILNRILG